jgi:hypothetical protein
MKNRFIEENAGIIFYLRIYLCYDREGEPT